MRSVALILYGISGMCLLALETIWIRSLGLQVGGTALASALVLVVFFLCAAAGNLAGAALCRRVVRPFAAYGLCEVLTALSTAGLFALHSRFTGLLGPAGPTTPGSLAGDALFVAALAGLPSFLAGVSFPLLSAALVSRVDERTRHTGAAYAGNLLGAGLGIILGGVVLPAALGYTLSLVLACALLGLEGVVAIIFDRRTKAAGLMGQNRKPEIRKKLRARWGIARDENRAERPTRIAGTKKPSTRFPLTPALSLGERGQAGPSGSESNPAVFATGRTTILPLPKGEGRGEGEAMGDNRGAQNRHASTPQTNLHFRGKSETSDGATVLGPVTIFASGALTIGLEVLCLIWFRQTRQPSVYALAATLFAFIVGLGAGAAAAAMARRRGVAAERALTLALWAAGILALTYPFLFHALQQWSISRPLPADPMTDAVTVALTSTMLLLPLLLAAGAVLPLAWELARRGDASQGRAVGMLTSLNKLGAAAGAAAAPLLVLPALGLSGAVVSAGAIYLLLAGFWRARCLGNAHRISVRLAAPLLAGALAVAAAWWLRPAPYIPAPGETVLAVDQGAGGIVATMDDPHGSRHIVQDQFYVLNGTGKSLLSQQHESWIPLTLAPDPRRVLFIGMASGISANAALDFPITRLDTAELVPGVARAAHTHFSRWNERLFRDPRARLLSADGRRVVQAAAPQSWDVVICDLLLPSSEGTSALYSRDFLQTAASRLSPEGLFCLWLPLYQHDETMAGIVIRTFLEVFPNAIALRGNFDPLQPTMALIGSRAPLNLSNEFLAQRLASEGARRAASESPLFRSPANFRLLFQGDLAAVREDFADFPAITDDRPIFAFIGPRVPPHGKALRGNTLLNWFGRRFQAAPLPSCRLGDTAAEEVRGGLDAGNYYFSAAIQNLPLPGASTEQQLSRLRNAASALQTAQRLSPASSLVFGDLGF